MFALRDYQARVIAAVRKEWEAVKSTLVVLPTGTGKTEIFVQIAQDWPGRVMVICPMVTLIGQAAKKICQRTGIMPAIEQGELRSLESCEVMRSPFIVASKQSLASKERYKRFRDIGLVIVDEAHLSATAQYAKILKHYREQGAHVLGVTATPKRHDKVGLGELFESCAINLGISECIDQGWLVPPNAQTIRVQSLDLSTVKMHKSDFSDQDLGRVMSQEKVVCEVAEITAREVHGEKTAVFCASVAEARGVAERLVDTHNIKAAWICADEMKCSAQERRERLQDFTEGETLVMCNVGILTTGWDFPELKHIVMARPTKSLGLYTQIMGRATRPLPGIVDFPKSTPELRCAAIAISQKPHFRLTDLRDNSVRMKLTTVVDVLGGDDIPEFVRARAKETLARGESKSVREAIEQARRHHRAAIEAQLHARAQRVNIFAGGATHVPASKPVRVLMPSGKWKGTPICDVDAGYLRWVASEFGPCKIRNLVCSELLRRGKKVPDLKSAPKPVTPDVWRPEETERAIMKVAAPASPGLAPREDEPAPPKVPRQRTLF